MTARVPSSAIANLPLATLRAALTCAVVASCAAAQTAPPTPAADPNASARSALSLAQRGRCREALPVLKRTTSHVTDKELRYHAAMAAARCAMSLDDTAAAVDALLLLRRDFPGDPEVLYVATHFFSQLADRAAQELAHGFPTSPQVAKLNAESLEAAQRWDEAIGAYRKILAQDPTQPEIHFRIARIILDKSPTPESTTEAKKELEEELKIDPQSASAEFVLGELARRAGEWDASILHFTRASEFDAGFLEAYLALGMSLSSAGKYAEAIGPLQQYVKMTPEDPAGHYQLAMAYSHTGNKEAADRELRLQREALDKARRK
jgi:tetratricopeptide (TPR) repeat protein